MAVKFNAKLIESEAYQALKGSERLTLLELSSLGEKTMRVPFARHKLRRKTLDLSALEIAGFVSVSGEMLTVSDSVFTETTDRARLKAWREKQKLEPAKTSTKKKKEAARDDGEEVGTDSQENGRSRVDYEAIRKMYNETCPMLPESVMVTSRLKSVVSARWKTVSQRVGGDRQKTLDFFRFFFEKVATYKWMAGQNEKGWVASLVWLMNEENFRKIVEGQYDGGRGK